MKRPHNRGFLYRCIDNMKHLCYNVNLELFYENSGYSFTIDILSVKESKHRVFKKICSDIVILSIF